MNTQQVNEVKFELGYYGKRLSDCFALRHEVVFFVPTTVNGNQQAPASLVESVVRELKDALAHKFGGSNSESARLGQWPSETLGMIHENNIPVHCLFADLNEETDQWLYDAGEWLKVTMSQESVLVVLDGVGYFI